MSTAVKPILFSGPMIRALLEGRKTQTRRIVKPQPYVVQEPRGQHPRMWNVSGCIGGRIQLDSDLLASCPYGRPGDLLWARETWALVGDPAMLESHYRADYEQTDAGWERPGRIFAGRWTPSIHMPRWASRLTLRLTDVRVQRLQEISQADAIAEGCPAVSLWDLDCASTPPSHHFRALWDSINGAGAWDANPWVWALTFEVIRANVDAVLREGRA